MGGMRFGEVPQGGRFEYGGRIYLKGQLNFAKDEQQKSFLFPSETEVRLISEEKRGATDAKKETKYPSSG